MTPESPMETSSSEICAGSALRSTSLSTCLASSRIHLNFEALTSVRVSPHALHLPTVGRWVWFPASLSTSLRSRMALRVCPSAGAHDHHYSNHRASSHVLGVRRDATACSWYRSLVHASCSDAIASQRCPPPPPPKWLGRVSPRRVRRTDLSRRFVLVVFRLASDLTSRARPGRTMCFRWVTPPPRAARRSPPSGSLTPSAALLSGGSCMLQHCRTRFVPFPTVAAHLPCLATRPELQAFLPRRGRPRRLRRPSGPRNAHTPRRIHSSDSRVDSHRRTGRRLHVSTTLRRSPFPP